MPSKNMPNVLTDNTNNTKDVTRTQPLHRPQHIQQQQQNEYKDCLPCRLVGTATFWGLGTYTIYHSYSRNPKLSRGFRFGLVFIGFGKLCVILGIYIFFFFFFFWVCFIFFFFIMCFIFIFIYLGS